MKNKTASKWLAPALLLLLGSINVLFGALQIDAFIKGPPLIPDDSTTMYYFTTPIPILLHIIFGTFFNLLAPLQFVPHMPSRWRTWHRWSGRLLIGAGVGVGLTGLWMNQVYPAYGGSLKYVGIVVNSVGLIAAMGIALRAILAGNVPRHRVWMMRAVAFGLGAATQRLFILPVFFILGGVTDLMIGLVIWFGFLLNLSVVQLILWRDQRRKTSHLNTKFQEAT